MRRIGRSLDDYEPQKKCIPILKAAMDHIQSVPYKVTLRWVFYRLLQDGVYNKKEDYKTFIRLQAQAKKYFYDGWRPDTLADETREVIIQGEGWDTVEEWIVALEKRRFKQSIWHSQKHYIEIWFEAQAMQSQFLHYAPEISLLAFHGDCSIAPKWEAAKRLEIEGNYYDLPVVVLYFGDYDAKGITIPESAMEDIRKWCSVPIEFVRAGLNHGDGERLGIPESIDKPGAYQWEALSDEQAELLIKTAINEYFDEDAANDLRHSNENTTKDFQERIKQFVEDWQGE